MARRTNPELVVNCASDPIAVSMTEEESLARAKVFAALGDPVRLRLYSMVVASGEVCSCDLEGPLERSQPTISHHTRILAEAGLIVGEKRGKWTWWRAVPGVLGAASDVLGTPSTYITHGSRLPS